MRKELDDTCRIRVRFSELDPMGIVWHGTYVKYLEDGRESFGRHYPGIDYATMAREHTPAPVYDLHLRHLAPLRLGDTAEVRTVYVHHIGARLDFRYEVRRLPDRQLCLRATTTQLFTDAEGRLLPVLPPYVEAWQRRWLGE